MVVIETLGEGAFDLGVDLDMIERRLPFVLHLVEPVGVPFDLFLKPDQAHCALTGAEGLPMLELHYNQRKLLRRHPNDDAFRFGTPVVDGQVDLNLHSSLGSRSLTRTLGRRRESPSATDSAMRSVRAAP